MHPKNASEGHDGQTGAAHRVSDSRLFERRIMQNRYNGTTSKAIARGVADYCQNALSVTQCVGLGHCLRNAVMKH